jgi:SAM-dependent methyltransferase
VAAFDRFTSSSLYRRIYHLFDHPAVFNAYQVLVDGGKERRIRRFLKDTAYETVVDVGCGTGNWAITARGRYLGVDVSREFVQAARERYAEDPSKQFLELDPTSSEVPGEYDLAQMVSVLHHLSDDQVARLLERIVPHTRYLFILDLYPISWNPVARFLYAADRGDYIREPAEQKRLISRHPDLKLVREDDYFAPTGVYRHTLMLFENSSHG